MAPKRRRWIGRPPRNVLIIARGLSSEKLERGRAACEHEVPVRVIAGSFGGRRLRAPAGLGTRPTVERVREALFNVLGSLTDQVVLDIYAGSGSLGIEALSRGAARAVFVEQGREAAGVIRANLQSIGSEALDRAHIVMRPIEKAAQSLKPFGPYTLCLVDPPFAMVRDGSASRAIASIVASKLLTPDALVVVEYPSDHPRPSIEGLTLQQDRHYGDTGLAFFSLSDEAGAEGDKAVGG